MVIIVVAAVLIHVLVVVLVAILVHALVVVIVWTAVHIPMSTGVLVASVVSVFISIGISIVHIVAVVVLVAPWVDIFASRLFVLRTAVSFFVLISIIQYTKRTRSIWTRNQWLWLRDIWKA